MSSFSSNQQAPGPAAGGGKLDDLFDYNVDMDEVFRDISPPRALTSRKTARGQDDSGLGIDEEVEVVRKPRAPRVKLDEDR